jgi:hypothetical protein
MGPVPGSEVVCNEVRLGMTTNLCNSLRLASCTLARRICCRQAKPKEKPYKLADSDGLYLEVALSGGKWWRLKYRINGKEKRISPACIRKSD